MSHALSFQFGQNALPHWSVVLASIDFQIIIHVASTCYVLAFRGSMMCHTTYYEWRLHRSFRGDSISMKAGKISQVRYGEYQGKNPHQKGIQDIQSQKFNELKRSSSTSVQHPGFLDFPLPIPQKNGIPVSYAPPKKWLHLRVSADHGTLRVTPQCHLPPRRP